MTAENQNTDARYHVTFFEALKKLFVCIIELIKRQIAGQPGE